jgi:hypothetical protein
MSVLTKPATNLISCVTKERNGGIKGGASTEMARVPLKRNAGKTGRLGMQPYPAFFLPSPLYARREPRPSGERRDRAC